MASTDIDVPLPAVMPDGPDGRMHRLLRGCERLAAGTDDSEGLSAALAECCLALPSDVAVVWLAEPEGRELRPVAAHAGPGRLLPLLGDPAGTGTIPVPDGGPLAEAWRGETVHLAPSESAALPPSLRQALAPDGELDLLLSPVPGRARPLGIVLAGRRAPRLFAALDLDVLQFVARLAGSALDATRLVTQSRRQAELVDAVSDAVVAVDRDGIVVSWNRAAERIYVIQAEEAVGASVESLLPQMEFEGAEDPAQLRMHMLASGSWRGRVRQTTRTGVVVEVESSVSVRRDDDGEFSGWVAVNRDITEMLAAQAAVQHQVRFTQDVMDALETRAAVIDADGRVRAVNARWRTGLTDRDHCVLGPVPLGHNWTSEVLASSGPEYATFAAEVEAVLRGERAVARMECRCAAAGPDRATAIEVVQLAAQGTGAVVVQSDVSWRRRLQDELTHRATHDELTGLPNRAALREGLSTALYRLDGRRQLAVLFCDLDGFKDVNDGFGHAVGDQVLIAVARRLRQRCRSADVVARFGGDEFVVVLTVPDPDRAVGMAERIVEALAEPLVVGDAEIAAGVSIGITVVGSPPEGDDPVGALLRDADTAMYQAKERGRGRFEFFDAGLRKDIAKRVELSAALHRAATDGELSLSYQALRFCGDRSVAGVEALLQWRHPHYGPVDPGTFIPIAERTGRIVEIGRWALQHALAEFAKVADPRLTVAVNVSPRQLTGSKLPGTVDAALEASGLDPWRLVLEITEGALVDDPTNARTVLTDLRKLGVTIALDDFGTGWSSLSYLRTLPVDVIKIDRSFISALPTDLDACAVVSAVLNLGHGMGLVVVAEGVERLDQLAVLRDMGCDEYQGFIDGTPGRLDEVVRPIA